MQSSSRQCAEQGSQTGEAMVMHTLCIIAFWYVVQNRDDEHAHHRFGAHLMNPEFSSANGARREQSLGNTTATLEVEQCLWVVALHRC